MRRVRCMQRDAMLSTGVGLLADGLQSSLRYLGRLARLAGCQELLWSDLLGARARPCRPSQVVGSFHESDTSASRQDNQANELLGTVHTASCCAY